MTFYQQALQNDFSKKSSALNQNSDSDSSDNMSRSSNSSSMSSFDS